MSKLIDIKNIIFPPNKDIEILNNKIEELSAVVEKSALSDSLEAVVGTDLIPMNLNAHKNAYSNNYVIYRGINIVSQSIAALPMQIYKDQELIPPEKVQSALKGFDINFPNKEMSLYELLYITIIYHYYRGDYINYIDLEDRISLEPIDPKKIVRSSGKGENTIWRWDNKINIPNDQLIYLPLFNPDSITDRGLSPVEVIKKELLADDKAREYNIKFFENFGKIGGALFDDKTPPTTTASDMKVLVDEFNIAHQSSGQAYKILGLTGGVKYQELGQTMKEMEFLSSRKDIRDRILSILGIHKSVFGVTDQVDRANADMALRQLWIHTLQPTAIRIQNKFNQHLFKRYFPGYRCKFDLSGVEVLQENKKDVLEQAKIYRELGYTINEVNELFDLGMDEIDDPIGDMRFVPTSLMPMTDFDLSEPTEGKNIADKEDKLDNLVKFIDKEDKVDKVGRNYIRNYTKLRRSAERKIAGKMGKYFSTQLGKVLHIIKDGKAINKINEIEVLSAIMNLMNEEKDALNVTLGPVFRDISKDANQLAMNAISITGEAIANEVVVGQMVNKVVGINNYTYKLIRNEVRASVIGGESVDMLSKRIINVYKFNSSRSRTIARTESGALINRSTNETYKEHNVKKKQWVGGTRETHAAQNGDIKLYNEPFANRLMYPHDPSGPAAEVVNCTCALSPVIER